MAAMEHQLDGIKESPHKVLIKDKGEGGNLRVDKPYGHSLETAMWQVCRLWRLDPQISYILALVNTWYHQLWKVCQSDGWKWSHHPVFLSQAQFSLLPTVLTTCLFLLAICPQPLSPFSLLPFSYGFERVLCEFWLCHLPNTVGKYFTWDPACLLTLLRASLLLLLGISNLEMSNGFEGFCLLNINIFFRLCKVIFF